MISINSNMQQAFNEVSEMMKYSSYKLDESVSYYYCKVDSVPTDMEKHFLISQDDSEITVVTNDVEGLDLVEKNENEWLLLDFRPEIPFKKGTILILAAAIFNSNSNILVVSTYSKDYMLIKRADKDRVVEALASIGLKKV